MAKKKLLVIEDDNDIRQLVEHHLTREGYDVSGAADGESGLKLAEQSRYDLVILDLMLPGIQGLEVCRSIRAIPGLRKTGVLIVSAKDEETDVITGLELGADDYLAKPFSIRVLIARVRSVLRRLGDTELTNQEKPFEFGRIKIDLARHEVIVNEKPIELTLAEFRILENLAKRQGRVLTRNQLLDLALGKDHFILDRTIDVHVSALRRKLGKSGEMIETVRGVGYRLQDAEA